MEVRYSVVPALKSVLKAQQGVSSTSVLCLCMSCNTIAVRLIEVYFIGILILAASAETTSFILSLPPSVAKSR